MLRPESELTEIEITPEMIEAGVEFMWRHIERPFEDEMRRGAADIYRAMERVRREALR